MKRCQIWMRILQEGEMNRMAIERIMGRSSRVAFGALVLSLAAFAPAHAQTTGVLSVCVKTSDGSMRMLLGAAAPSPASCSAGEQFTQWVVQTPPGAQRTASSPWRNHVFLSGEICIGDSGDFDDG